MPLLDQIQKQMVEAMKAREEARLNALRMVKAALMKHKVDTMKELDEAEELKILNMLIKQRREAADMFRQGGRIGDSARLGDCPRWVARGLHAVRTAARWGPGPRSWTVVPP